MLCCASPRCAVSWCAEVCYAVLCCACVIHCSPLSVLSLVWGRAQAPCPLVGGCCPAASLFESLLEGRAWALPCRAALS